MITRILVPVDGSSYSRHAVEAAGDLANRYQVPVYLLHVIRDMSLPKEIMDMIAAGEVTASRREILEDSAQIMLDNAEKRLNEVGISDVHCAFVFGDPAAEIALYAERESADLIAIGHRGLNPAGGMLGSVTRKLLSRTEIACLIVT